MSRITVHIDEDTARKLNEHGNKSKTVKEALNMYFLNKEFFMRKQEIVEREIREIEFQLDNKRLELDFVKKEISKIEKREGARPRDYNKVVCTLKCLPDVVEDDLRFQAERLNISLDELKSWLWLDGYYEEIFK